MMMKTFLLSLAFLSSASAFAPAPPVKSSSTALNNFLDGRGRKVTVREDEDAAMWIDDGKGGRTPGQPPKRPDPKKQVKKEAKKGGFKLPWDNERMKKGS